MDNELHNTIVKYCQPLIDNFNNESASVKQSMFTDSLVMLFIHCLKELCKLSNEDYASLVLQVFNKEYTDTQAYHEWAKFWKDHNNALLMPYPMYIIGRRCIKYIESEW